MHVKQKLNSYDVDFIVDLKPIGDLDEAKKTTTAARSKPMRKIVTSSIRNRLGPDSMAVTFETTPREDAPPRGVAAARKLRQDIDDSTRLGPKF